MEQDVLGLDVAVDHAITVGIVERVGHFTGDPHRFVDAELGLAVEFVAERLALDVGHDVVEKAVGGAGVEQRQDVRVLEVGGGLDLDHEPLGPEHGGQLGLQDLEGHLAIVLQVLGQVDGGHAALPQLPLDPVAVGQGGLQAV